jgi:hypothetical protein
MKSRDNSTKEQSKELLTRDKILLYYIVSPTLAILMILLIGDVVRQLVSYMLWDAISMAGFITIFTQTLPEIIVAVIICIGLRMLKTLHIVSPLLAILMILLVGDVIRQLVSYMLWDVISMARFVVIFIQALPEIIVAAIIYSGLHLTKHHRPSSDLSKIAITNSKDKFQ